MVRKLWVVSGIALVLIGVAGVASYNWRTGGDLTPVEKAWTFDKQALQRLEIKSDYNVEITFVRSTDGTNSIRLVGEGTEKMASDTLATEIADGALELDLRQKPERWFHFFDFNSFRAKEELTIALADGAQWDALDLKLDSGNATITDAAIAAPRRTNIDIDSGNVTIERFKGDELNIDIDSGNVTADGVEAKLTVDADSGNMRLNDVAGAADLSVDSGNIRLYKLTNAETNIEADSGNIYVQVPPDFAGFYDAQADSGRVKHPESKRLTTDYVKARADSGNITIEQQ
ncbi:DUF4097 family beta strand repeat-containing protein [Cohnella panacarvi]|uniref:DUF4097 family beta strand repeat-containing protein n=1 Tax=Cohnella panacarvi TaxID=400776 RepID=UPI00047D5E4F|nr:DUF4097 family beta strand repeat-containing protein [Cohnella panacarvi]